MKNLQTETETTLDKKFPEKYRRISGRVFILQNGEKIGEKLNDEGLNLLVKKFNESETLSDEIFLTTIKTYYDFLLAEGFTFKGTNKTTKIETLNPKFRKNTKQSNNGVEFSPKSDEIVLSNSGEYISFYGTIYKTNELLLNLREKSNDYILELTKISQNNEYLTPKLIESFYDNIHDDNGIISTDFIEVLKVIFKNGVNDDINLKSYSYSEIEQKFYDELCYGN